jgi:hypothetical protein
MHKDRTQRRTQKYCGDRRNPSANLGMAEVEDNPVGHSNIEALPAVKEGIDRPGARSQNCDGSTHRRQQDPTSQVVST